jgi:hypothetical protein
MDDVEKLKRKFLREAAQQRHAEAGSAERRRRAARPQDEAPKKIYCTRCLAMFRGDGECPRCEHNETNVFAYCRTCLRVHGSLQACTQWVAGQCPHCKKVHDDPASDCPCRECGKVHRTADGAFRVGRCEE